MYHLLIACLTLASQTGRGAALPPALTAVLSLGAFGAEDSSRANNCTKARAATSAWGDRPCQTVT